MVNRNSTVNGLPLTEILSKISAPYDGNYKLLEEKYKYIPIEQYERRLISVVGSAGYYVEYPTMDIYTLPTGQLIAKARAIIYIYDDNCNVCYKADGWGTYEEKKYQNYDRYKSLNTLGINAKTNAFKSACDSMQMFGKHLCGENGTKKSSKDNSNTSNNSGKSNSLPKQVFTVSTNGAFEITRHDNSGKPVYEAKVLMDGKDAIVIFYPNQYKNCQELLNKLYMAASNQRMRVNMYLSELNDKEIPTFVFKGFANGGK